MFLQHRFPPADPAANPVVGGRTENDDAIVGPRQVRKPILEWFGSHGEVELLQTFSDGVIQEIFEQDFARGPGGKLDVEGRLVPIETTPVLEPEMKSQRSAVEQDHVESEPAVAEGFGDQFPVEELLCGIEKLAGRVRLRPPGFVLIEKNVQTSQNLLFACTLAESKVPRFLEVSGVPLQAGLVCRLSIRLTIPQNPHGGVRLIFNRDSRVAVFKVLQNAGLVGRMAGEVGQVDAMEAN